MTARPPIVIPPLPTETQIQQMRQRARERDEFVRHERLRAGGPGKARSLSEFFDAFYYVHAARAVLVYRDGYNHDIDSQIWRNLRKAVIRTAHGPCAPAMRAAARSWQIDPKALRASSYARLRATMLVNNPPLLTGNQITRAVTRVRKDLEAYLRQQHPQLCPRDERAEIEERKQERLARRHQKFQQQIIKRQQRFERQERRMLDRMDDAWHSRKK